MTEENQNLQIKGPGGELDAAGKSLSEALRNSFIILKFIMIVLVVVFLVSGFRMVGSDEEAVVLRFGKIRGIGEDRTLKSGLHWVFPYPIDQIIKVPVGKKVNVSINSFWYHQTQAELLSPGKKARRNIPRKLNPIQDGYCLTRSEKQDVTAGGDGSDYNIVHSKWQLIYQIDAPERFFTNVYTDDVKPGQSYAEVIAKSVTPILKYLFEDAVVSAMANYSIDEALASQERIPKHVRRLLQDKLDTIQSGIKVVSVQLTESKWPRQVDMAFQASIMASNSKEQAISEARSFAENTLNETAGPVAERLLGALHDESVSEAEKDLLWFELAGRAQEKIAEARAYRTKVVKTAQANAEYLHELLGEYRKRPELVVQEIYLDAIKHVLNNVDEKIIVQPTEGAGGREFRLLVSRDPTIKPKKAKD